MYRKLFIVLGILMVVSFSLGKAAMAQRYSAWTGQTAGEYELTSDVTLTSTVRLSGDLTIHVGTGKQIKRGSFNGDMFYVQGTSSKTYKLTIKGEAYDTLYIDGGAVFINNDARPQKQVSGVWTYNFEEGTVQCTSHSGEGRVININNYGALELENVVVKNVYAGKTDASGSAIFSQNNTTTRTDFKLTKCVIRTVLSGKQGSAMTLTYTNHDVLLQDFKACYCNAEALSGGGSTIRTTGPAKSVMVMDNCEIYNNCTNSYGGGIAFYMGGSADAKLTIKGNTKVHHNLATDNGGGMIGSGVIDIKSAEFYENRCTGNISSTASTYVVGCGGGIYLYTYSGFEYYGQGIQLTMDENVSIHDNYAAWMGGGICVDLYPSDNLGFIHGNTSSAEPTSADVAENIITIDGAKIFGNTSSWGGGICVYDRLPKKHKHSKANIVSPELKRSLIIKGDTEISGNKSINRPSYCPSSAGISAYSNGYFGGGICVLKCFYNILSGTETDYTTYGAGEINVSITGGRITNNVAYDKVNTANNGYGGGVTAEDKFITTNYNGTGCGSKLNITVGGSVVIDGNECKRDGGGLDIESSEFLLTGATITNNKADNRGGGVFITAKTTMTVGSGDITVKNNTLNGVPNNIHLISSPSPKTIAIASDATFNPNYVGIYTESTETPIPVFTGDSDKLSTIYDEMQDGTMNIFDDKQLYSAKYTDSDPTTLYFDNDSPWSPLQRNTALTDLHLNSTTEFYEIGSVKELTAFLCHVNGISPNAVNFGSGDQTAKGKLTADIDMEGHYWVPIGKSSAGYTGIFDGNGYTISHLTMTPTNTTEPSEGRGMFGLNQSGTITNVILRDCYFGSSTTASTANYMGGIVSQNNSSGKVSNNVVEGTFHASNSYCIMGGIAGSNSGTIHSSFATPSMEGYQMGGLVGANSGNLFNSFANASFDYKGDSKYCGGLVGVNTGRVENCYSRVQATAPSSTYFGYLTGNNTSTSEKGLYFCYAPNATYVATVSGTTAGNRVGLGTYSATSTPYLYNHRDNQVTVTVGSNPSVSTVDGADKQMLIALNKWVTTENTEETPRAVCTYWLRPTTKTINDDLPILRLPATNAVAATDGEAYLDYNQVNELLTGYTTATQAICLYGQEGSMNSNSGSAAPLYIDQEATLIPASDETVINGYTSQMINKYESSRWHDFSSPLQQSDIGFTYHNSEPAPFSWSAINPCSVTIADDDAHSLFPSDLLSKTTFASVDLYCFYEPEYHWLNLKRDTHSHWHMNATTEPINYVGNGIGASTNGNETYLVPGKGYLVSIDVDQLLQNYGTLNNGDVPLYSVTKSDYNAWAGRLGFNLLGNPYQSYLDFEQFMDASIGSETNAGNLWTGSSEYNRTYATFDPKLNSYVQYKSGTSVDANTASQYIHPHQGFFIRMTKGTNSCTTVKYTNDMRSLRGNDKSQFRGGEQPAYPLINFLVRDSEGNADIAVLELGRTEDDGATKMRMNECKGMISLGYGSEDFGILFRTEVEDYQPLHFEATEEGIFTLTWNTANAEFDKLTLIDNITGTTTDMLGRDSYSFEATPDQYASRFKVVIGDYKGIDEPEVPEPVEEQACKFAFQMGDRLVVNGEGNLQIIDMLGRVVMTDQLTGSQSTTSLPKTAGVYVLRLTDTNGTRTQKMVIR